MTLLSNTKIFLSLFFIINSIFLAVDARILNSKAEEIVAVPVPLSSMDAPETSQAKTGETSQEVLPTANEKDSKLPEVTVSEIDDIFVTIATSVVKKVGNDKISGIKIEYEIKVDGKWIRGDKRPEKVKIAKVSIAEVGERIVNKWKVGPLQSSTNYQFFVSASYGTTVVLENPEALSVTTKASAPKTTITNKLSVLKFDKKDVKSYHVQINKVKKDASEADCVFEASLTPCFGQEFLMPELTCGEKYVIDTWYIDLNGNESEHVKTDHTA